MGMNATTRDLSAHLGRELEGLLSRHIEVARVVLPADELCILAIGTAYDVALSMVGVCIQFARDEAAQGAIYDMCVDQLVQRLPAAKQLVIRRIAEERAKLDRAGTRG